MPRVVRAPSLAPCRPGRIPGPRRSLLPLALIWLLAAPLDAAPVGSSRQELRCICLTITPGIHPKMTRTLEVVAPGPQCPDVQVIAVLKNEKEVCLDPAAPLIKKIVQKMLDSGKKEN